MNTNTITVEPVLGDPWFGRPLVLGNHNHRHGSFLTISTWHKRPPAIRDQRPRHLVYPTIVLPVMNDRTTPTVEISYNVE